MRTCMSGVFFMRPDLVVLAFMNVRSLDMATVSVSGFPVIHEGDLFARLAWLRDVIGPRLERYLGYYRNTTSELAAVLPCAPNAAFAVRSFRQFQELGLPGRITGFR